MSLSPEDYPITVAGEVRAELARQRRTQSDMADALGITSQTAARRLTGDVPFDVRELVQLAAWLGVSLRQLMPEPTTAVSA